MTASTGPTHVVVDGSNIATEGRSLPSLAQLNEAVMSFMEEYPDASVTVVVDATFGHRIDKKELEEFEEGISNNELVAPPAGAVGRGDAFVLSIAQKANASILSNDSFQEFHGDYEWLFDEGRLIGGKPVPHVGWVFVDRVPVRGPVSRKATSGSRGGGRRSSKSGTKESKRSGRKPSAAAMEPMPVPTAPPPNRTNDEDEKKSSTEQDEKKSRSKRSKRSAPKAGDPVNELMPFLEFVEHHPVGTSVNGTVESYSSHGAYITIGENGVRGYVPLRLMGDPAPTSARKVMKLGESVTLVVVSFAPSRRSIDCALPDMADAAIAAAAEEETAEAGAEQAESTPTKRKAPAKKAAAKKRTSAKASTAGQPEQPSAESADAADATEPTEKRTARTRAAKKAPAKKSAKKQAATNAPAKKQAGKKSPAKKQAAKKSPAKKQAAKKAPAKKAPAKKQAAKKSAAKKTAAKKSPVRKQATKKSPAKKSPAKKQAAKKSAAKKQAATSDTSTSEGGA